MLSEDKIVIKEAESDKKNENATESGAAAEIIISESEESTDRVGNLLCHERLKKGLELEDVSQVLCIRRVYLEAIESGHYVELPPLPYSAGFVNSYAKYLGLNNTRITQLFREELNDETKEKRLFMTEDLTAEASVPDKRYIIGGVAALFLIGGLWSLWYHSDNEMPATTVAVVSEKAADEAAGEIEYFSPAADVAETVLPSDDAEDALPAAGAEEPTILAQPIEQVVMKEESFIEPQVRQTTAESAATVEKKAAVIEIKITKEDTWIEVRDNKKVYFNKVMRPGETYRVPEGEGMILSAGKYKGVEVYVNGKLTPVIQPNKKTRVALDPFVQSAEH